MQMHDGTHNDYYVIAGDVETLHLLHATALQLFGSADAVGTWRLVANDCACTLQVAILDSLLLRLMRLLDPIEQFGKTNLVLESLILKSEADSERESRLKAILDEVKTRVREFKTYRHTRLAHRDRDTAFALLEAESDSLKATWQDLKDVLDLVRKFMNLVETEMGKHEFQYNQLDSDGDGEGLMSILQFAVRATELQKYVAINRIPPEVAVRQFREL